MNLMCRVIFGLLLTAVLLFTGCTSSTSTIEHKTYQYCTPPTVFIVDRCGGGNNDDSGGLDGGGHRNGMDEPVIEEGAEVLRVPWGSDEGQLGYVPDIPEGPASFFVGFAEQIFILDQLNSRVQVYQDGSHRGTIPVPTGYYFQDIDLSQDNDLILLDRRFKKAVVFLTSSGSLDCEVGLIGEGISDASSVTGLYSRYDGIWVGDSSKLLRIAKVNGAPDPDRPFMPGLFSKDDSSILSAEKDGELSVVLYVRQASNPENLSHHVIRFDMPVTAIEVLESDMAGRIDLGVQVSLETGGSEGTQSESYVVMVILNNNGSELRRFLMPFPTNRGVPRRSIRVGADGTIYQMRFDAEGARVVRYKP